MRLIETVACGFEQLTIVHLLHSILIPILEREITNRVEVAISSSGLLNISKKNVCHLESVKIGLFKKSIDHYVYDVFACKMR